MDEKRIEELNKELQQNLTVFFKNNEIKKDVEKIVKDLGTKIKEALNTLKLESFEIEGLCKANLQKKTSSTMNEEKLLEICKSLNIEGLIKTREYVDTEMLETLIYNNEVDPTIIAPAKEENITYSLVVKGVKK